MKTHLETRLGHRNTASSEDSVRSLVRNFDLKGQSISDANSLNLLASGVNDRDLGRWSFWSSRDADHVRIPDGHHSEGDVPRGRVVRASHFVDLVGLGHDDAVTLDNDGVGVDAVLFLKWEKTVF